MNTKRSWWKALMVVAVLIGGVMAAQQRVAADVRRPHVVAQARKAAEKARATAAKARRTAEMARERAETQTGQHETERGDVMNLDGDVNIDAEQTVKGDVVAVGGTAHVRGKVNGNVVSIDGDIHLYEGAKVRGDVMAIGGKVVRESGAEVVGSKVQIAAPWAEQLVDKVRITPVERGLRVNGSEGIVEFGKSVHIEAGEEVKGDLVVFGGSADIEGKVQGDAVVFGGPLDVDGYVRGDAVSIGGSVHLRSGSTVGGDAVSIGGRVKREPGAELGGQCVGLGGAFGWTPRSGRWFDGGNFAGALLGRVAVWLIWGLGLLVVTLLVVLVLPHQTDVIATTVAQQPGRAVLYGLVGWLLVLPVLVVLCLLIVTWVVIPFYLAALTALAIMGGVGISVLIGRRLVQLWNWRVQSVLGMALIGFLVLRLVDLVGVFPPALLLTGLISLAVLVFGFGGALMTRFGTDATGRWIGGRLTATPPGPPAPAATAGPAQPTA